MYKFICYNNNVIIIPDFYSKNLAAIQKLVNAAKLDFPFLKDEDIDIEICNSCSHKNKMVIKFKVPFVYIIPNDYIKSDTLLELK